MFKRIDHVEIVPSDYERSIAFYCDVLGFSVKQRVPLGTPLIREIAFLTLGDTMLELLDMGTPAAVAPDDPCNGYRMMALEVDDMGEALAYLATKGVQPSREPYPSAGGFRAEVRDPDGLRIEIRQW